MICIYNTAEIKKAEIQEEYVQG
ncbi:hypothetical protein CBM2609_B110003 [Cupriavidus taiwanensis]|uniref:Uncharacterized protein n=1 Tax=Cupriavidus taiwanensis TaxID=164546 RepID=A0A975XK49_9BURK|nr:hypothetical protein CBM2586_B120002 [Cupriavidus taiwanensis]SOZ17700.1 hypothetical protein CBM2604_B120002 [Cupriavidus taiwanensis]SOZ30285.1 hypothetical protein CBM2609_B110003 [Cupriavidus taiwanensis]SOZ49554.1 hypothetical protein CBM2610_B90003 [Cupriavidus taiwanensis]SOZ64626.1 hypothetical protein CBM2614_B180003 [Cupriavidus taiwanensis]